MLQNKKKRYTERRGCDYFEWHDEPFNPQARKVIKDLQDENGSLKIENAALKCGICDRTKHDEFHEIELECAHLRSEIKVAKDIGGNYKWKLQFCMLMVAGNWLILLILLLTAFAIGSKH